MDAIQKLIKDDFAAGDAGDIEALLELRTDDAVEIFSGALPLIGKDAIRTEWNQQITDVTEQFKERTIEEIRLAGDWAFVRYSFIYTVTPWAGGESIDSNCNAVLVIRRQPDDLWKIHWEMVNSSDAPD